MPLKTIECRWRVHKLAENVNCLAEMRPAWQRQALQGDAMQMFTKLYGWAKHYLSSDTAGAPAAALHLAAAYHKV